MNHKAMLELADHLEKMPKERFDMAHFGYRIDGRRRRATRDNACGTTCCIAGEKVLMDGGEMKFFSQSNAAGFMLKGDVVIPDRYAAHALGLTDDDADGLFFDYSIATPTEAADRIRRMVKGDKAGKR